MIDFDNPSVWKKVKEWLFKRQYFMGVDMATKAGDYSAKVTGYKDRKGTFRIVDVEVIVKPGSRKGNG